MIREAKIQNLKAQLTHVYWKEEKAYPFILYSSETKTVTLAHHLVTQEACVVHG